jgi:hypothetical protein
MNIHSSWNVYYYSIYFNIELPSWCSGETSKVLTRLQKTCNFPFGVKYTDNRLKSALLGHYVKRSKTSKALKHIRRGLRLEGIAIYWPNSKLTATVICINQNPQYVFYCDQLRPVVRRLNRCLVLWDHKFTAMFVQLSILLKTRRCNCATNLKLLLFRSQGTPGRTKWE